MHTKIPAIYILFDDTVHLESFNGMPTNRSSQFCDNDISNRRIVLSHSIHIAKTSNGTDHGTFMCELKANKPSYAKYSRQENDFAIRR